MAKTYILRLSHNAEPEAADESINKVVDHFARRGLSDIQYDVEYRDSRTTALAITAEGELWANLTDTLRWGREPWQTVTYSRVLE